MFAHETARETVVLHLINTDIHYRSRICTHRLRVTYARNTCELRA